MGTAEEQFWNPPKIELSNEGTKLSHSGVIDALVIHKYVSISRKVAKPPKR
jgi:hypothetical protein